MKLFYASLFSLLFLIKVEISCLEFEGCTDDGNVYKFFLNSSNTKSFDQAKASCESLGGALAVLDSDTSRQVVIDTYIANTDEDYKGNAWVGATLSGNDMHWTNGKIVDVTYRWISNNWWDCCKCMTLRLDRNSFKWDGRFSCGRLLWYICQFKRCNSLSTCANSCHCGDFGHYCQYRQRNIYEFQHNIITPSPKPTLSCGAVGKPTPNITWMINEDVVDSDEDVEDVTNGNRLNSTLTVSRDPCMGEYHVTCLATIDGSNKNQSHKFHISSIDSYEPINEIKITPQRCTSKEIYFDWEVNAPSHFTLSYEISWSMTSSTSTYRKVTSVTEATIQDLATDREYQINVTAITQPQCKVGYVNFTKTINIATLEKPAEVNIAEISAGSKPEDYSCVITWNHKEQDEEIDRYFFVFTIQNNHNNKSTTTERDYSVNTFNMNTNESIELTLKFPPNSIINGEMFASNCVGNSTKLPINNNCKTAAAAPDKVLPPSQQNQSSDGTFKLLLEPSDEANGDINCYFIVMEQSNDVKDRVELSQDFVDGIQQVPENSTPNKPYFTLALKRIDVVTELLIGDGNATSCGTKEGVNYKATNLLLEPNKKYRYFVLTATSVSEDLVSYGPSDYQYITYHQSHMENQSLILPIAISLVACVLLGLIVAIFIYRNRLSKEPTILPSNSMTSATNVNSQYVNVAFTQKPVNKTIHTVHVFVSDYKRKLLDEWQAFIEEFQNLSKTFPNCTTTQASKEVNKKKNRYKNILPYDYNRVALTKQAPKDYINASYIDGYFTKRKFIAAQAPTQHTLTDFWLMIVKQNIQVIVMLAKCVEKNKVKCLQYWPDNKNTPMKCDHVTVTLHQTTRIGEYIKRIFQVAFENGNQKKTIVQYQYTSWPDHNVPTSTTAIKQLHKIVNDMSDDDESFSPILVHCSAGVGRTGTFIGYDILKDELNNKGNMNVPKCVETMRQQRMQMVQAVEQYVFLHKLLVEDILLPNETKASVNQLMRSWSSTSENVEEEYLALDFVGPLKPEMTTARKFESENFDSNCIPYDRNRISIKMKSGETSAPYYNASYIKDYHGNSTLIAAQNPTKHQLDNYWRMIVDNNVRLIACMDDFDLESVSEYESHFDSISINEMHDMDNRLTSVKQITITYHENSAKVERKVLLYQFKLWKSESLPKSEDVERFIVDIRNIQIAENEKLLIQCRNGCGRTGVALAILNAMKQIETEKAVDVFLGVKDLRDMRPCLVTSLEMFRLCYDVIISFAESTTQYVNI